MLPPYYVSNLKLVRSTSNSCAVPTRALLARARQRLGKAGVSRSSRLLCEMDGEMSAIRDFQGYVTSKRNALAGAPGKENTANLDRTESEAVTSGCDVSATGEASKAADSIEIRHDHRLVGGREMWMLPGTLSVLLSTSAPATEGSGDRPHWRFWGSAVNVETMSHESHENGASYFETARRAATQVYDALPTVGLSTLPVALSASASSLTAMVQSIPRLSALSPTRCLSRSHSDPDLFRHSPGTGVPVLLPPELRPKGSVLSVGTFALEAALRAADGAELPLMALLQGFDVGTGKVLGAMGPALALVVKGLGDNIAKVLAACAKAQAQVPPQPCETVREVLAYEIGRKLHVQGTADRSAKLAETSAAMGLCGCGARSSSPSSCSAVSRRPPSRRRASARLPPSSSSSSSSSRVRPIMRRSRATTASRCSSRSRPRRSSCQSTPRCYARWRRLQRRRRRWWTSRRRWRARSCPTCARRARSSRSSRRRFRCCASRCLRPCKTGVSGVSTTVLVHSLDQYFDSLSGKGGGQLEAITESAALARLRL